MITVVQSTAFTRRCEGKYTTEQVDELVYEISRDPYVGKKMHAAGNLYQYRWSTASSGKHEYDAYYVFHSKVQPIVLVNIFKRGTKAVLDKVLATLAEEIVK